MSRDEVEADLPRLRNKTYDLSPKDFNYNCLAFALGDLSQWWEPPRGSGRYWPDGFPNDIKLETAESIIRLHGYSVEVERGKHPQTAAIAIFALDNEWTHFAKFTDGVWSSKLGDGNDVSGVELHDMECDTYGEVVRVLQRPMKAARKQRGAKNHRKAVR